MKARLLFAAAFLLVAQASLPVVVPAATITVTTTDDSGPGSLRNALASAANGDTIDASGVTGTILLTNGELVISNDITILGPGPDTLAISGNSASRVFNINSNATASISGLTISDGNSGPYSGGGGLYNAGTLTLTNCIVADNSAG